MRKSHTHHEMDRMLSGLPYLKNPLLFIMGSENSHGWGKMPINDLLKDLKVGPEEADRLTHAFTFTLKSLHLVDRNDPVCRIVAAKVIEIDKAGIHDPHEIAKLTAKQLGVEK